MDILNKYNLAFKGLSIGEHEFSFDVDDSFFAAFPESEIHKGRAKVKIKLTKKAGMLTLDFNIAGEVEVVCDRCLDEFMMPFDYEGTLLIKFSEEPREDEADAMWLNPSEQQVNLAQYIYESIILSLPYQRVHPDRADGTSGCNPDMLKRFRIVTEEEFGKMFGEEEKNTSWEQQIGKLKGETE